jgi:hypothetical protein
VICVNAAINTAKLTSVMMSHCKIDIGRYRPRRAN